MSHEYFIWMSYGAAAILIAAELVALRVGRARARRRIEEEKDLETQD
jgi:heme exporter protein CcmD